MGTKLEIVRLSEVESKPIDWLWYPYIPYGKLTMIQGDPGGGKTMLILHLAGLLSSGHPLPFDNEDIEREPIVVIYQTSEDGYDDTIKPRLESFSKANLDNIIFINEEKCSLTMLDERIEEAIIRENARLFILDPIQAYVGNGVDINRANEVRPLLKNLAQIAQRNNCAIILIGHMNKDRGSKSSYRNLGSIDFPAACRSVLICGEMKGENGFRAVVQDKCSLAPNGKPFAFELSQENGFKWIGYYDITAEEVLGGMLHKSQKNNAIDFIETILSNGPIASADIFSKAEQHGIAKRTLDSAKSELGVTSYKKGNIWYWKL